LIEIQLGAEKALPRLLKVLEQEKEVIDRKRIRK
jgi:hypothetical protein